MNRRHAQLLPSVLDRLLDDQPDNSHGAETMLYELAQIKRSLARDLEALLNTGSRRCKSCSTPTRWPTTAC